MKVIVDKVFVSVDLTLREETNCERRYENRAFFYDKLGIVMPYDRNYEKVVDRVQEEGHMNIIRMLRLGLVNLFFIIDEKKWLITKLKYGFNHINIINIKPLELDI